MKRHLILMWAAWCATPTAMAEQTGSWGDQGDGTYRNPVLEANYPDNDVIRVGDTFYMMSSTNHFVPAMTILKSKDLVNWEFSNHIMPAPIRYTPDFNQKEHRTLESLGTWAGSFGYNGETYFAYWCFNRKFLGPKNGGTYQMHYATAKSMEGPWSEPRELTWTDGTSIDTTDPGVFWDLETKKAWIGFWQRVDQNGPNEIRVYELAWDGSRLLNESKEGFLVTREFEGEAVKIHRIGEMYYITAAHWRKHDDVLQRMAVVLRAKTMEGPWEGRLAMENGNGTDRSPSQGSLLQVADGSWWFIHQLARGNPIERYNGRPQCLQPVEWKDGWPLIGVDTDGDGVGEVVWHHKKPITGFPVAAPASDDDFSGSKLGQQWYWRFNPRMDRWSLNERPGWLRLKACARLSKRNPGSLDQLPNLIGQRLMGRHDNVMTAKFDLSGMANGQEAGLHVSAGENNRIGVKKDGQGGMRLVATRGPSNSLVAVDGIAVAQDGIWLRAQVEDGLATFFYSLDGNTYTQLGGEARLEFSGFTANAVGFYSMNDLEKGHIDVDCFTYDYDGPKKDPTRSAR